MKESEHTMKQATAKIGATYAQALPKGWTDFILHLFVPAKASEEFYAFYSTDGGKKWNNLMNEISENDDLLMTVLDGQDAAMELHEICAFEDDNWTEMTYKLNSAGKFDVSFDYKKIETISSEMRRQWNSMAK